MASVNEKSRTLNLLYKMTNALYGQKVRIERDPLHRRFEVNRYGVYLESKTRSSKEIARKITEALVEKLGAEVEKDTFSKSICYNSHNGRKVRINMVAEGHGDRLYIMIH